MRLSALKVKFPFLTENSFWDDGKQYLFLFLNIIV